MQISVEQEAIPLSIFQTDYFSLESVSEGKSKLFSMSLKVTFSRAPAG